MAGGMRRRRGDRRSFLLPGPARLKVIPVHRTRTVRLSRSDREHAFACAGILISVRLSGCCNSRFPIRAMKRSHLLLLIVILPGAILLSGCASKRVQDNGFVQSAKELDRQALRLYWRGETKQALLAWSAAIDKEPGLARAYYNRGICKASLGRHGSAVADFDRALQRRSGFVSALVNRALSKLRLGDDAQGLRDLRRAEDLAPDNAAIPFNIGRYMLEAGRLTRALRAFSRAAELKPDMAAAYNNRGIAYLRLGRFQSAVSDFSRALRFGGENPDYYFNRAVARQEADSPGKAEEDYTRCLELAPDHAAAYLNRGSLRLNLGRRDAGCRDLRAACKLGLCERFRRLQARGMCPAQGVQAREKRRESEPEGFLSITPDDAGTDPFGKEGAQPPSPEGAGPDSVSRKRIATAERQKGSSLEPGKPKASRSSPPAEANLAGSQPSGPPGKDLKGDRSDVSEAAVMRESYARALRILLREDRYLEARRKFEGFIAGFPESRLLPNAYYWLGETYYVRQEYRHSIRIFRQGAERFPEHPKAPGCLLKIGLAYKSLDQASQAAKYFRMVTRKYPKSRSARIAEEEMEGL